MLIKFYENIDGENGYLSKHEITPVQLANRCGVHAQHVSRGIRDGYSVIETEDLRVKIIPPRDADFFRPLEG